MDERNLDDPALLALIAQKSDTALSVLYDRYHRLIMSIAFHIVGNRETAEEITIDIFTTVWKKAETYQVAKADVRTWLTRITRNRSIDVLRYEKSRPLQKSISWDQLIGGLEGNEISPESAADLALSTQHLRAAISALPPNQKDVLFLAYFRGYSHREIAQALDQPLGTVKTRLRAAMQKLRDVMAEYERSEKNKSNLDNIS